MADNESQPRFCNHCGHYFAPNRYKKHLKQFLSVKSITKEQRRMLERWVEMMTQGIEE